MKKLGSIFKIVMLLVSKFNLEDLVLMYSLSGLNDTVCLSDAYFLCL